MHRIRWGNDLAILYIRKHHDCSRTNDDLGALAWTWVRDNANGRKLVEDQTCVWGDAGTHVGPRLLPKTSTQYEFDANRLQDFLHYLDQLGTTHP